MRKNIINEDLFLDKNQITKESAYILGLMWADGTVSKSKNNYGCSVTGISEDFDLLRSIFESTGQWGIYIRSAKGIRKQQTTYLYTSKSFHSFLSEKKYQEKSQTSASRILNHIPERYHCYWWRGYFDGDGCIYTKLNKQLFFTGALNQDWDFFNFLPIKLHWKHITKKTNKGNYSRMLIQNKPDILAFFKFIYSGDESFGLERKKNKMKQLFVPLKKQWKGKGYYLDKNLNKWYAAIIFQGERHYLGVFELEKDAKKAVEEKRNELL